VPLPGQHSVNQLGSPPQNLPPSIKVKGGLWVFLSVGDYFFAMYLFCVVQKSVGPTGKCTSKIKCPRYKC